MNYKSRHFKYPHYWKQLLVKSSESVFITFKAPSAFLPSRYKEETALKIHVANLNTSQHKHKLPLTGGASLEQFDYDSWTIVISYICCCLTK